MCKERERETEIKRESNLVNLYALNDFNPASVVCVRTGVDKLDVRIHKWKFRLGLEQSTREINMQRNYRKYTLQSFLPTIQMTNEQVHYNAS